MRLGGTPETNRKPRSHQGIDMIDTPQMIDNYSYYHLRIKDDRDSCRLSLSYEESLHLWKGGCLRGQDDIHLVFQRFGHGVSGFGNRGGTMGPALAISVDIRNGTEELVDIGFIGFEDGFLNGNLLGSGLRRHSDRDVILGSIFMERDKD